MLIREPCLSNFLPLRHKIANVSRYAIRSLKTLLFVSLQFNYTIACQYHLTLSLSRRGNEQSTELLEDTHFIISYFRVSVLARSTPVARHNTNRTGNNLSYLYGGDAGFVARYERISERTFPSRERQPGDNRGSRGIDAPQPRCVKSPRTIKNKPFSRLAFLVEMRDLPYSDCYRRSIACSRRGSHGDAVLRFFKIAINPRFGIKKGTAFAVPFLVEMRGFEPRFILTRPIPSTRLVGD